MKKIIALTLTFVALVSMLAACGGNRLPKGMSGSDSAKVLLANERLDSQLLKTEGDIFENGVKVMNDLAKIAMENLNVTYMGNNSPSTTKLSSIEKISTVLEGDYSGKVEIDGDTFTWSNFEENNNSYDYFRNITNGIVASAEVGADLIDNIKKNVRVVDKWIEVGDLQYYLSVDENSETLYERYLSDNSLTICKRYKNAEGDDVYELYRASDKYEERCTYIPGKRYERSSINDYGDHAEDYFVADNSKGYWETYTVGAFSMHYNVSYFIMKDDICYDAFYDPKDESIPLLKVMSADKATDIINFSDNWVSVKFSGFDGVKSVEAPADSVQYMEGEYANLSNYENAKVYLKNGRVLNYEDRFVDDKVIISAIHVGYGGGFGYTGEIDLNIQGETDAEILENLRAFLNEVGLKCRRNIDSVFAGIHRAYGELDSIIKYYTWNDVLVIDESDIGEAVNREKTRFGDMKALYTAVEDAEVLDISDTKRIEMNIKFAPIIESGFYGVTLDAGNISVDSIYLTIDDTALYVENEPYKVMFALANANSGLVHLDIENTSSIKYVDEDIFTVTASQLNFSLPALASGDYTLVAYIATSDGIRSSAYIPVSVSEITDMPISLKNMTVSAVKNGNDILTLTYSQAEDFAVTLTTKGRIGYEDFKKLVSKKAFEYGIPSDIIEVLSGDAYTALTGDETEISDGAYRISYKTENGDQITQGYIYVQYSCE